MVWFDLLYLTPLSAIIHLYHDDQFYRWKMPEYQERTTDHGQATGKLYHLRLWVVCTLFSNLQSRAWTHAVFVIGLYELLKNPPTYLTEPPRPSIMVMIHWRDIREDDDWIVNLHSNDIKLFFRHLWRKWIYSIAF
jgi:hypothetical protein